MADPLDKACYCGGRECLHPANLVAGFYCKVAWVSPSPPTPDLSALLGMGTPWPVQDVLRRLADAADHLLRAHGCDVHGYEGITIAAQEARKLADALTAALRTSPAPPQTQEQYEQRHERVIERIGQLLLPNSGSFTGDELVLAVEDLTRGAIRYAERKSFTVAPAPQTWEPMDGSLTIRFLQYINAKRAERWHGLKSWSALEWAGAMAGEAGEACNAAKKLKRIEDGIANINLEDGRSLTDAQNASAAIVNEIADTVIYGVLLAERVGLDLEEAIRMKFNRKSEEYGFPERIPPNQAPPSQGIAQTEADHD